MTISTTSSAGPKFVNTSFVSENLALVVRTGLPKETVASFVTENPALVVRTGLSRETAAPFVAENPAFMVRTGLPRETAAPFVAENPELSTSRSCGEARAKVGALMLENAESMVVGGTNTKLRIPPLPESLNLPVIFFIEATQLTC
jgi:hypothetical protein